MKSGKWDISQKRKSETKMKINKLGSWRLIPLFFIVMLVCTILSRAADSVTIPRVKTENIKSGILSFQLEGEGIISGEQEEMVFLPENGRVLSLTEPGTKVKTGDILARFDKKDLEKKRDSCQAELRKLEITLEQEILNGEPAAVTRESEGAEQNVSKIQAQLQKIQAELEEKQKEYEQQSTGTEGLKEGSSKEEKQKMKGEIQALKEEKENLEQSLSQAQELLETAKKNDADTESNNRKQQKLSELSRQSIQIDIDEKKKELEELEELIKHDGSFCSPVDGTVTEVTATAGMLTGGQEYFKIGSGNTRLTADLNEETAEGLKEKDQINVQSMDGKIEAKGKVISLRQKTSVQNSSGQSDNVTASDGERMAGQWELEAELEENELTIGSGVYFQAVRESKEYKSILPMAAIREDSEGKYVLILEEQDSILGKEMAAARVTVKILEKDSSSVAVESVLTKEDAVIVGSNKTIKAGDRVREEK